MLQTECANKALRDGGDQIQRGRFVLQSRPGIAGVGQGGSGLALIAKLNHRANRQCILRIVSAGQCAIAGEVFRFNTDGIAGVLLGGVRPCRCRLFAKRENLQKRVVVECASDRFWQCQLCMGWRRQQTQGQRKPSLAPDTKSTHGVILLF